MILRRSLIAKWKEVHKMLAAGFFSRYLGGPLPYIQCHLAVNKATSNI